MSGRKRRRLNGVRPSASLMPSSESSDDEDSSFSFSDSESDSTPVVGPNRLKYGVDFPRRYPRRRSIYWDYSLFRTQVEEHLHLPEGCLGSAYELDPKVYVDLPLLWKDVQSALMSVTGQPVTKVLWGDMLQFNDYRGCGLWFVGGPHWDSDQWRLLKAYGEMGYVRPLEFYDSPKRYFEGAYVEIGIFEELFDLSRLYGCPYLPRFLKRFKEIKEDPAHYRVVGDYDYRIKSINIEEFPGSYWGLQFHRSFIDPDVELQLIEGYPKWVFDSPSDFDVFVASYERRLKRIRNDMSVILALTLRHILPWDVCVVVMEFGI